MSIELTRRQVAGSATDLSALPEDKRKRVLELSAYFTIPGMDPSHVTLALFSAMNLANKNKQLSSALSFANALIEKGTNAKFKDNVSQRRDATRFHPFTDFIIGAQSQGSMRTVTRRCYRSRVRSIRGVRRLWCVFHSNLRWRTERKLSLRRRQISSEIQGNGVQDLRGMCGWCTE